MRFLVLLLFLFTAVAAFAQQAARPLTKPLMVKTNILSLIAQRPTLSVEKFFTGTFSAEASFVQGRFNNLFFTDHYNYSGFLLRAKKHLDAVDFATVNPYVGIYLGNLKRNIQTEGRSDRTGWFGYPSRDFSANSLRTGGSLGFSYITKRRFVMDMQGSLGYGRYLNLDKSNPNTYANGFLDMQIWFSLGYCF
jgi:hypothetical protein